MANTYTQHHLHCVIGVERRKSLINPAWKNKLYRFITGIVQGRGHKLLQINGMPDHVHILIGLRPNESLSDLMKIIKQESSRWVNMNGFTKHHFSWQKGFGAFSISKSDVHSVIHYIQNQEEHHRHKTFTEEYIEFLESSEVEFDARYIFKQVM